MARSLPHLKAVAAGALSRFGSHVFGLRSDPAIVTFLYNATKIHISPSREYSAVAGKVGLSAGSIRADRRQGDDKGAAAGYRQRSWMPDPVTGCYIPEDHFGETDIAELRENMLKEYSATSRRGPN